jgi:hypothetical protein
MTSLEKYPLQHNLDPIEATNVLQDHNVISDNCVNASDVAPADCFRACVFLETWRREKG